MEDDWFEISDDCWLDPRFKPKKLRLLADAQVPQSVIDKINAKDIVIESLTTRSEKNSSDPEVLQHAHKKGCVLLTLDKGFWSDQTHPLQSLLSGIIYIAEPPDRSEKILHAFELPLRMFC